MSFSLDLLTGLHEVLADAGVGHWNPSGIYTANQVGLTIGGLPPSPDRAISAAVYGTGRAGDDIAEPDSSMQVQFRIRGTGDPRTVDDLADGLFDTLHGASDVVLPTGVLLLLASRKIVAPLDKDSNGRHLRADSYELLVHRPSPHRPA
ncbi:minor capsid protein [Nonomuraea sp. NPDC050663]|uniref:minor capsid protein n=1 Tax=Nonomuraea sp. NPDC050663 TaxID=3364370 RepID=UPI00379D447A